MEQHTMEKNLTWYLDNVRYNNNGLSIDELRELNNDLIDNWQYQCDRTLSLYDNGNQLNEKLKEKDEQIIALLKNNKELNINIEKLFVKLNTKLTLWERLTGKISQK